jgi:hypothetical protein
LCRYGALGLDMDCARRGGGAWPSSGDGCPADLRPGMKRSSKDASKEIRCVAIERRPEGFVPNPPGSPTDQAGGMRAQRARTPFFRGVATGPAERAEAIGCHFPHPPRASKGAKNT